MVQQDALGMTALLGAMRDSPSVPDGWDLVLNLSESAVQALVRSDWEGASRTAEDRALLWVAPAEENGVHDVIEVKTDLPPPVVRLNIEDQAVHVTFAVESGTLQFGKAPAGLAARLRDAGSSDEDGDVSWSAPVAITEQNPLQLAGTIPVGVEAADDCRSFSIGLRPVDAVLSLSSPGDGAFSTEAANHDLTDWLAARKLSDQIGNFTLRDGAGANLLTPAAVAARVVAALDGQPVLQILTGASPGATAPASSDPVPHSPVHDFSIIVSSKATMTMIANSYNQGSGVLKLASVPPEDEQVHWFAQIHEPMVFEGSFGRQDGETYVTDHSKLYMRFGGSTDQGLKLFTYIDPDSTIQLELDLAAHYPVGFTGTDTDRVVGLSDGAQSVTANGFYEAIVQPQLEKFLTGDIKSDMSAVRMPEISNLMLRDLTLSGHELEFAVAALPGELLIAGVLIPAA